MVLEHLCGTAQQQTSFSVLCCSLHSVRKCFQTQYSRPKQAVNLKYILDTTEILHECYSKLALVLVILSILVSPLIYSTALV